MREQIAIVERCDGNAAAREYAARTLRAYRGAAQFRDGDGRKHFAHDRNFRRFFVAAICELREYLRRTGRHGKATASALYRNLINHSELKPIALITGATGNLGRSLGAAFGSQYRIVGLDQKAEGADFPVFKALHARFVDRVSVAQVPRVLRVSLCENGADVTLTLYRITIHFNRIAILTNLLGKQCTDQVHDGDRNAD